MTSLQMASLDEIRQVAARMCRDYLTGRWKVVNADQLVVKRISGGLSNFLYYVSLPELETTSPNDSEANEQTEADMPPGSALTIGIKNSNQNEHIELGAGDNNNSSSSSSSANKRQRTESGGSAISTSVSNLQKEPREVLLRIYGQTHGEDALEAMITESVVFALLSERNFGPKLHGIFPGGRIEQYIPARPLATIELATPKISMKIAEKMGEIHSLNIPMSKEPDWLWNCMNRWLKSIANSLNRPEAVKKGKAEDVSLVRSFDFREEAKWLKSTIEQENFTVLFCHNDMQEGNILLREPDAQTFESPRDSLSSLRSNFEDSAIAGLDEVSLFENLRNANVNVAGGESKRKRIRNDDSNSESADLDNTHDSMLSNNSESSDPDLRIIDFEYCAYNYRGFDLANHFLEWTFDYSNPEFPFFHHHMHQYPTKQQRQDFILAYLRKLHEGDENYVPTVEEVEGIESEVRVFSMFSHLFWSLWSVVNVTSNIEFGYWEYGVKRIQEFKRLKQEFMIEKNSSLD